MISSDIRDVGVLVKGPESVNRVSLELIGAAALSKDCAECNGVSVKTCLLLGRKVLDGCTVSGKAVGSVGGCGDEDDVIWKENDFEST